MSAEVCRYRNTLLSVGLALLEFVLLEPVLESLDILLLSFHEPSQLSSILTQVQLWFVCLRNREYVRERQME